jgi:hypothetical protein
MLSSVEAAEICLKILDWKIKNGTIGDLVSLRYINYVEEVQITIDTNIKRQRESLFA